MASQQTTLMIGTTKGAFLATSKTRKTWDLSGPHCGGWPINHMASDPKTGKIWAAGGSEFFGAGVWRSLDQGQTWDLTRLTSGQLDGWAESEPEIAKSMGWTGASLPFNNEFTQIWSIKFTNGTLYAGTKPAQLLQSKDGGKTWSQNDALANFPDRGGLARRRGRSHLTHDCAGSEKLPEAMDRHLGCRCFCYRGWRQNMGPAQSSLKCRLMYRP